MSEGLSIGAQRCELLCGSAGLCSGSTPAAQPTCKCIQTWAEALECRCLRRSQVHYAHSKAVDRQRGAATDSALWQVQLPASANNDARPSSLRMQRERAHRLPRAKCSCSLRMCRCRERCLMLSGSTCTSCSSLLFASCNTAADLRFAPLTMGMAAGHRKSLCGQICLCSLVW